MQADWRPQYDATPRPGEPQLDTWEAQLDELAELRHPDGPLSAAARAALAEEVGDTWIRYPWRGVVVRLLPPGPFREVRLARNRYKILAAEQARLLGAHIGIVGLSVGRTAALTLAMAGIGGRFRIADADTLGLSNLNRLAGSVADLGVSKAVLCARAMLELDPYLSLEVWSEGVPPDGAARFVEDLDLLIEECDSIPVKVALRRAARAQRVPVLMDTSDRGLLDIERYDRDEPHPELAALLDAPPPADPAAALAAVAALLGTEALSARSAAAILDHPRLRGWPQTAPDVALGGALLAEAARAILLAGPAGGPSSGRSRVDLRAHLGATPPQPPLTAAADLPTEAPPAEAIPIPAPLLAEAWARCSAVWCAVALHPAGDPLWQSAAADPASPAGVLCRMASRPDVRAVLAAADGGVLVGALVAGGVGVPRQLQVALDAAPAGWLPLSPGTLPGLPAALDAQRRALAVWLEAQLALPHTPRSVGALF